MTTTRIDTQPMIGVRLQSVITSYGEGHHDAPSGGALLVDTTALRNPPDDEAVRERMLHATGLDPEVRQYVMDTPGAQQLVERAAAQAAILLELDNLARWSGVQRRRFDIHVRCGGGRHRSVAVAEEIAVHLRALGIGCEVEHRHINKPILRGGTPGPA